MTQTGGRSTVSILVRFSIPLILSGVLQQLYSWADAFIVGRVVGEEALAAVGATSIISLCMIFTITGFTTGLSVLAAQKYGRGEEKEIQKILSSFLPIILAIFTALALAGIIFTEPLLRLIDTPEDMFSYTRDYIRIIFAGVPFLAVYNLYAAMLRAVGNSRAPFYAVMLSSCANVGLDIIFVVYMGKGVAGAAFATLISQIAMTVFMISYAARKYEILRIRRSDGIFHRKTISDGFRFAIPLTIQQSVNAVGNVVLQGFMNSFGSHAVAAITSAYRVDMILLLPIVNLGAAVSTMVAQSKGAGDREQMKKFTSAGIGLCLIVSVALACLMFFEGGNIIKAFGLETEAALIGERFFRNFSLYYVFFGLMAALRGAVEGSGRVLYSSLAGMCGLGIRIALSYMLAGVLGAMTVPHAEGIQWIILLVSYAFCTIVLMRKKDAAEI